MLKTLKKIILSSVSILSIGFLFWIVLLLNPSLSYANKTQVDNVTIHHNQELEEQTESIIQDAISIIKNSDIYDKNLNIEFCLNDDKVYPNLYPFAGATAYAFFDKTIMYASEPNFRENVTVFKWEINSYELRKYNLTSLLAHEFMHNYQNNFDSKYYIFSTLGSINWKLEGHAEYIAREFKNDGKLKSKINKLILETRKEHIGFPVFKLEDGTIQSLSYYKYALMMQYLMEEKGMNFKEVCDNEANIDELFAEMIDWSKQ